MLSNSLQPTIVMYTPMTTTKGSLESGSAHVDNARGSRSWK